ncbi:MAG: M15 family metallopeptidase [Acidimicrobiales bacterium]
MEQVDAELATQIQQEEQRIAAAIAARNRPRSSGSGSVRIPDDAPVDLTTVRGIVVNVAIADQLEGLLAAMEAQGFPLGGGGYRSSASQIALRRAHCGTSDYAIYEMPSYECSPPTAPPGRSEHEKGLAIDFSYQGQVIGSRSSAVYQALASVAGDYGFYNLPSEPWHWSTTGN